MKESDQISYGDKLALDRTKLANVRTFLAFFRSFVVILSSGFAIVKIDFLKNIYILGIILMIIAFFLLVLGIIYYLRVKKRMSSYK